MADEATQEVVLEFTTEFQDALSGLQNFQAQLQSTFGTISDTVNENLGKVQESATATANHFTKEGERAGAGFLQGIQHGLELVSGIVAAGYFVGLKDTISRVGDMAENLSTLSIVTGDSRERLQQFDYALTQVGVPAANLQFMLTMLQSKIAELSKTAEAGKGPLHALGLDPKQLGTQDTITQLETISDKIKNLPHGEQVDIARQLFGRSGAQLLPLLELGAKGIETLMKAFKPIPDDVLESFAKFVEAGAGLTLTFTALNAQLLQPLIELMTKLELKVTDVINKFRDLSKQDQLRLLIGLIAAAALGVEGLLTVITTFFRTAGMTALIDAFELLSVQIRIAAGVVLIVAAAWKSNFAGIRDAVMSVYAAVLSTVPRFEALWASAAATFQAEVIPAFSQLSDALRTGVIAALVDSITSLLQNQALWSALGAVISGVESIFTDVIGILTQLAKQWQTVADIIGGYFVAKLVYATAQLITSLGAITARLISTAFFALATGGAFDAMVASILAASVALGEFLIIAASAAIIVDQYQTQAANAGTSSMTWADDLHQLWAEVAIGTALLVEGLLKAISAFITSIGDSIDAVARFVPGLDILAGALKIIAGHFDDAAHAADRFAAAKLRAAQQDNSDRANRPTPGARQHTTHTGEYGPAFIPGVDGAKDTPPGSTGSEVPDEAKGAKTNATSDFLDKLKQQLIPFQEAVKNATHEVTMLGLQIKLIGDIDSIPKLTEATNLLAQKSAAATKEIIAQSALIKVEQAQYDEIGKVLSTLGTKTADHTRLVEQQRTLLQQIQSDQEKQISLQITLNEDQKTAADTAEKYFKSVEDDTFRTWPERLRAAADYQTWLDKHVHTTEQENAALQQQLKLQQDLVKAREGLLGAAASDANAGIEAQKASTPDTTQADKVKRAMDDVAIATNNVSVALQKAKDAQNAYNQYIVQGFNESAEEQAAHTAALAASAELTKADTDLTTATKAVTVAENAWLTSIHKSVTDFSSKALGPLYTAFQALQEYLQGQTQTALASFVNVIIDIFEKTQAYADITTAVTEIVTQLAKVFNVLRPVIDFFLGILIGIVNVFIALYDVMATLLNMFGLQIQKIALLNSDLQNLNTAVVPLIQIVHNLPTINEFNSGQWANLVAASQQTNSGITGLNNTVLQGINKTMAKLGEIIGFLVGMYLVLVLSHVIHGLALLQHIFHTAQLTALNLSNTSIATLAGAFYPAMYASMVAQEGTLVSILSAIVAQTAASAGSGIIGAITSVASTAAAAATSSTPAGGLNFTPSSTAAGASDTAAAAVAAVPAVMAALGLSTLFGNGSHVGVNAYSGNGGSGGGGGQTQQTIQVTIENIHGLDPALVSNTLQPIFANLALQLAQQQATNTRTQAFAFRRGLSS